MIAALMIAQDVATNAGLIRLIIYVLLLGCLLWAIHWGLSMSGLPATVQKVILVIVALILLLFVLTNMGIV